VPGLMEGLHGGATGVRAHMHSCGCEEGMHLPGELLCFCDGLCDRNLCVCDDLNARYGLRNVNVCVT